MNRLKGATSDSRHKCRLSALSHLDLASTLQLVQGSEFPQTPRAEADNALVVNERVIPASENARLVKGVGSERRHAEPHDAAPPIRLSANYPKVRLRTDLQEAIADRERL